MTKYNEGRGASYTVLDGKYPVLFTLQQIHFAKLNQLKLFKNQFSTIYLSEIVYNETVSDGIRLQKEDAFVIKKYITTNI